MNQFQKIAVIGGGGRTGLYVVNQLLSKGFALKILLRNPSSFSIQNSQIEIITGDVLDYNIVESLVTDCDAIVSTVGQRKGEPLVASEATRIILSVIQKHQTDQKRIRYIALAGLNVDTPFDQKSPETQQATDWMKGNFPEIHEDRQKSYRLLAASDTDWTLVRVPYIEFREGGQPVVVDLKDCPGTKITSGDIADFMVTQLGESTYLKQAPFVANVSS